LSMSSIERGSPRPAERGPVGGRAAHDPEEKRKGRASSCAGTGWHRRVQGLIVGTELGCDASGSLPSRPPCMARSSSCDWRTSTWCRASTSGR
jgi:hypothetical protein